MLGRESVADSSNREAQVDKQHKDMDGFKVYSQYMRNEKNLVKVLSSVKYPADALDTSDG